MNLQQEKAQLLKRLAEIEAIETAAIQAVQKSLATLGVSSSQEMLVSMAKGGLPRAWVKETKAQKAASAPAKRTRAPNLTPERKKEILAAYKGRKEGVTAKDIARQFQVAENTIYKIVQGR